MVRRYIHTFFAITYNLIDLRTICFGNDVIIGHFVGFFSWPAMLFSDHSLGDSWELESHPLRKSQYPETWQWGSKLWPQPQNQYGTVSHYKFRILHQKRQTPISKALSNIHIDQDCSKFLAKTNKLKSASTWKCKIEPFRVTFAVYQNILQRNISSETLRNKWCRRLSPPRNLLYNKSCLLAKVW